MQPKGSPAPRGVTPGTPKTSEGEGSEQAPQDDKAGGKETDPSAEGASNANDENKGSGGRTEPSNLEEQLALEEAKQGAGKRIIGSLQDPKHPDGEKYAYNKKLPDGRSIEIHYIRNKKTGQRSDFKFK